MTYEQYKQYELKYATAERFIRIFGALHGRYMWNLYRNLDSSITALCQYRADAKKAIDEDIKLIEELV